MKKSVQQVPFLLQLHADTQDIAKIRQKQLLVNHIQSSISNKEKQNQQLKALLQKYQHYQHKYSSLKVQLSQKVQIITRKDAECRLLRKQLEEMIKEAEESASRWSKGEAEKQKLIRERHSFERASKQSEKTFKQYQQECRRREQQLLQDLERAYHQHKQQTNRIDELQLNLQTANSLTIKLKQLQRQLEQKDAITAQQTPVHRPNFTQTDEYSNQIMKLQEELLKREEQISRQQVLNYQLTLQYDQTVSSLCSLQSEVSTYRRQNTQLRYSLRQHQQTSQRQSQLIGKHHRGQFSKSGSPSSPIKEQQQNYTEGMSRQQPRFIETVS